MPANNKIYRINKINEINGNLELLKFWLLIFHKLLKQKLKLYGYLKNNGIINEINGNHKLMNYWSSDC